MNKYKVTYYYGINREFRQENYLAGSKKDIEEMLFSSEDYITNLNIDLIEEDVWMPYRL